MRPSSELVRDIPIEVIDPKKSLHWIHWRLVTVTQRTKLYAFIMIWADNTGAMSPERNRVREREKRAGVYDAMHSCATHFLATPTTQIRSN